MPLSRNIWYEGSEDVLAYKPMKRNKTGLLRQDLVKRTKFEEIVEARRKELPGDSEAVN